MTGWGRAHDVAVAEARLLHQIQGGGILCRSGAMVGEPPVVSKELSAGGPRHSGSSHACVGACVSAARVREPRLHGHEPVVLDLREEKPGAVRHLLLEAEGHDQDEEQRDGDGDRRRPAEIGVDPPARRPEGLLMPRSIRPAGSTPPR